MFGGNVVNIDLIIMNVVIDCMVSNVDVFGVLISGQILRDIEC